jgi:serine protease inhibitor
LGFVADAPKKYEEINVNYPFLYFIMDKEIDMAIIGGRILNPLNARIQ